MRGPFLALQVCCSGLRTLIQCLAQLDVYMCRQAPVAQLCQAARQLCRLCIPQAHLYAGHAVVTKLQPPEARL